jgi:hypothetical protein
MALPFKKLKAIATGPQGKKLLAQAKKLDTPQNREKAKDLVADIRKKAAPAAKAATKKATTAAKTARARAKSAPGAKPGGSSQSPPA